MKVNNFIYNRDNMNVVETIFWSALRNVLLILVLIIKIANAQVNIQPTGIYLNASIYDLMNVNVQNNDPVNYTCKIIIQVRELNNSKLVLEMNSSSFIARQGITQIDYYSLSPIRKSYGNSPAANTVKKTEKLTNLKYSICYTLVTYNELTKLSEYCEQIDDFSASSVSLLNFTSGEITDCNPILSYLINVNDPELSYSLIIVEDKLEKLYSGPFLINIDKINFGSINLNNYSSRFKKNGKYYWCIVSKKNNIEVARSEPGSFTYSCNENEPTKLAGTTDTYRMLKYPPDDGLYIQSGTLRFAYKHHTGETNVNYEIIDLKNPGAVPVATGNLTVSTGINRFDLTVAGLTVGKFYMLKVISLDKIPYVMKFKYI